MTNRIKILLGIFSVLLVLVFISLHEEKSETEKATHEIALKDTNSVVRITFTQPSGKTVTLARTGNQWVLDGTYEAREYLIRLILAGLNKAQVKREVAENAVAKTTEILSKSGCKVLLYNQKNEKVREFTVAANETDPNSAYYLSEGKKTPLVIFVPGFEGSIANVFALPPAEWRSKDFFKANERTLQKVSIEYPKFPEENFTIFYNNGKFEVEGMATADTMRIYGYLQNYQYLTINQYLTGQKEEIKKAFSAKAPLAILYVENLTEKKKMIIYEDRGKMIAFLPESGEVVTLRTDFYSRLLVKRSFFTGKK